MAPEIIEGDIFDGRKADVFSLVVLLFQLVIGRFPFSNAKNTDKDYKLLIEQSNDKIEKYKNKMKLYCKDKLKIEISREFQHLILWMFERNP